MPQTREQWHNRASFIMAAIGSAVGLGNVWRFPYVAYTNGGGAFLIPYFVALFTAGIPMLILEMGLGQRMQTGAPLSFGSIRPRLQWFGWWAAGLSAGIVIYYCTILAWSWVYLYHSLGLAWGSQPETFFEQEVLHKSSGPGEIGWPVPSLVVGMALTWLAIYLILRKGVRSVSKVVMITVPLPMVLLAILLVRGLTLPGAMDGIRYYLTPDFGKLGDPEIWLRAYGQIFFSLSLASGVMIGYGSYLGKKAEITNSALITGLANCGTSFFAGFVVFSMLGYLAQVQGLSVEDVTQSGTGLAFVAFPTAISQLPALNALFGVVFFITLLTLGIDSAFALQEAFTTGFGDKWRISSEKLARVFVLVAFPVSLIFVTRAGYYWFDIVDKWICDFGLVVSGLIQCLIVGFLYPVHEFREYLNAESEVRLGHWWVWALRYVTPVVLTVILIGNLVQEFKTSYEGYPRWATTLGGWGTLLFWLVLGYVLWKRPAQQDEA
ncbi:MAG: sodium-dependent transporter [Sedimentisphaerales bacterium]|nr:sodium-dependent transporter [Sedimentisphaerales bacterium]